MYWSVWAFVLYGPLFLVAFILGIVAVAQRRIVLGIALLLATIVIPLIEWLALAATRTNKFLDTQINLLSTPTPAGAITAIPKQSDEERVASIKQIYEADISQKDAHDIQIRFRTIADSSASYRPNPTFSNNGKLVVYGHNEGAATVITIKRLDTLATVNTVRTQRMAVNVALSPDESSLLYLVDDGQIYIKRLLSGEEMQLPVRAPGNQFSDAINWVKEDKVLFGARSLLDLGNLQITEVQNPPSIRSSNAPPCRITYGSIGHDNWGLHIVNADDSYGRLLLPCTLEAGSWSVSHDLRHMAMVERRDPGWNLIIFYLGFQSSNRPRMVIRRSEVVALNNFEFHFSSGQQTGDRWVFAPQVNPLNQKIIGYNSGVYRGSVIVTGASGEELPVNILYEKSQLSPGDVVQLDNSGNLWAPLQIASDGTTGITPHKDPEDEGLQITASGLRYKVISKGTGPQPTRNDTVTVHYRGTLTNGVEFDSSYKRGKPVTFRIDSVIEGWQEALPMMTVGSKYQLIIPPPLAYGGRAVGDIIPANSTLIFEVELLGIQR
jgi:hypothetical protein